MIPSGPAEMTSAADTRFTPLRFSWVLYRALSQRFRRMDDPLTIYLTYSSTARTGAAIRPTIGGSGNTAKCAVRIWSASAAVKNSHPNVQMPAIAAMPVGKKSIENVLQMLQVLKMSTWLSVTHLPNKTQSLTNGGTEIHRPVTENQVVKMSTSFFRNASRAIENQVPPPGT